jgi:hypothetical protein
MKDFEINTAGEQQSISVLKSSHFLISSLFLAHYSRLSLISVDFGALRKITFSLLKVVAVPLGP